MDGMVLTIIVVVAVAVIVIAAAFAYGVMQRRRSEGLQREFGDEYDRTVQDSGSRGRAESELDKRRKRVDALNIKPLSPEDRDRYAEAWTSAQAKFVDDPEGAGFRHRRCQLGAGDPSHWCLDDRDVHAQQLGHPVHDLGHGRETYDR